MDNINKEVQTKDNNLTHIYEREDKKILRNNLILNYIRENTPISQYKLSKDLKIEYKTISEVVKFLGISGLIRTKIILNEQNRAEKQISIPTPEEGEFLEEIKKVIEKNGRRI